MDWIGPGSHRDKEFHQLFFGASGYRYYRSLSAVQIAEREGLSPMIPFACGGRASKTKCSFAALTSIFVFRIRPEQARAYAANKNARYRRTFALWRREGDSNPRYSCPYNGFRDRPIQPLWHLSYRAAKILDFDKQESCGTFATIFFQQIL